MFWVTYITGSIGISLIFARISKKYFYEVFIMFLIIFLTPAQILTSTSEYAPSIFTFIFNVLFEQDFSTRVLRPLLLSTTLGSFIILFYLLVKRRFF